MAQARERELRVSVKVPQEFRVSAVESQKAVMSVEVLALLRELHPLVLTRTEKLLGRPVDLV